MISTELAILEGRRAPSSPDRVADDDETGEHENNRRTDVRKHQNGARTDALRKRAGRPR
jgi:hypothetical protein